MIAPPSTGPVPGGAGRGARRLLRDLVLLTAAVAAFAAAVETRRPLPFASTDDAPIYYGPAIQLHTDAVLAGALPRMSWELGAGWTPLESGQAGLLYPPYVLSNVVSRLAGRPLVLLEVSAWLHLWAAGVVVLLLLAGPRAPGERLAWALLASAQPAPFLLGMNWHAYVAPYPWFLAVALQLLRRAEQDAPWGRWDVAALAATSAGFWWAAHPQMYVIGVVVLGGWWLSLRPRRPWEGICALVVAQLPLAVPVLRIRSLAQDATTEMMSARATAGFALRSAQTLRTVLAGLATGNIVDAGFHTWRSVLAGGQGILFAPWIAWSWALAVRRRRLGWLVLSGLLVMILSLQSFPWLAPAFPAALGFRWTWKLAVYAGPLAMVTVLALAPAARGWRRASAVAVLALASAAVSVNGVRFDLWPALNAFHGRGFEALVAEARGLLAGAGVAPGARIAIVAPPSALERPVSAVMAALTGAAPVLLGLESAHSYEPLEDRDASAWHADLTVPWRRAVLPAAYAADRAGVEARLASIGVTWLVTDDPAVFPAEGRRTVRDHARGETFLRRIEGAPPSFPWDAQGPIPRPLVRLPGGTLRSLEATPTPPRLPMPREVRWRALPDGTWEGTPDVLPWRWMALGAAGVVAWGAALWAWGRWPRATSSRHRSTSGFAA